MPAGAPFLPALAAGILAECGSDDPLALTRVTVLLPTRRACRSLAQAFAETGPVGVRLLPRLMPLGDVDEDELALGTHETVAVATELAPAIEDLRRRLILARTILQLGAARGPEARERSAVQAAALAGELARLIDQVETERLSFDRLAELVPNEYAAHWQETLRFLAIVTEHWPAVLAAEGAVDPSRRRNLALAALLSHWQARPPPGPVYAAGSTGTVPATADLLAAIAVLPQGRVVLPGLDRDLDEPSWAALDASHPQYSLKRLLTRLGLHRHEVPDWPTAEVSPRAAARARLAGLALLPATTSGQWRERAAEIRAAATAALPGLSRIDCHGPHQEAGAIALLLREALEIPGRTAALVTPDRELARRVAAELQRWGIAIDDSGGQALAASVPGAYLRLVARMAQEQAAPVPLLACLKHPLAAGGTEPGRFRHRVRGLELAVLHGPRPGPGLVGLRQALDRRPAPDLELIGWLDGLTRRLAPLFDLLSRPRAALGALLSTHVAAAEALAATDAETGAQRLWAGEAGEALALLIADLKLAAEDFPDLPTGQYADFLDACLDGRVVRPRFGRHPRLTILGLLEARLLSADLVILGGLNEGTWPPEPGVDPWMSRPMRDLFGLPSLERRIGLTAHDFTQGFAAPEVVLTRATRVEGTPTVPSRWLLRLEHLLGAGGVESGLPVRPKVLAWQRQLDETVREPPAAPPAPCPPVAVRPRRLSVTEIETWRRDPYAIYARHVLGLEPLPALDLDPSLADYGQLIHRALDVFLRTTLGGLPAEAEAMLLATGRRIFGDALSLPGVRAFWWPRFERIAAWFVTAERQHREVSTPLATEVRGELTLRGPAGAFVLRGKADRIDRLEDGRLVLIDYKTGSLPSVKEIGFGYAPQLPLEAAIAAAGGFAEVPAGEAARLEYWRLGGGQPAGKIQAFTEGHSKLPPPAELARQASTGLERLIAVFDDPATPYPARPRPDYVPRFSDYDHLARVKEWSVEEPS